MQQEKNTVGDVKIDRARIQKQLQQFQQENSNMRSRGLEYSPRFKGANNLRMTGSGDNRPTSPTLALHSRISGKEKRRRVHAWLGAQVKSEAGNTNLTTSPAVYSATSEMRTLPVPELPAFATLPHTESKTGTTDNQGSQGSPEMHSNSEFVPGVPVYPAAFKKFSPADESLVHHSKYTDAGPNNETQHIPFVSRVPTSYPSSKIPDTKSSANFRDTAGCHDTKSDLNGGGDNYCYVYDPLIAKAYTKKYPISPSINTPPPSTKKSYVPNLVPGSQNFTPSPMPHFVSDLYTRSNINGELCSSSVQVASNNYGRSLPRYGSHDVSLYHGYDTSFPLPTKYEEYDMRPIKPLDADVKKSLYGETLVNNDGNTTQKKPKPYLRRSHSAAVSYPVPRSASRNKEHHITDVNIPMSKIQTNVENKRKGAHLKGSPMPSPLSPRRRRQQKYGSSKNKKRSSSKLRQVPTVEAIESSEEEKDDLKETTEVLDSKQTVDLPVDLKHVKAATKIQAVWKGYRTRKLNPRVVEIRQEVRARRAEQYISVLCHEVQCLKENLDAEKKMRDLQTEAIRYIWSQLRTLQKQKPDRSENRRERNDRKRSPDARKPRSKSNSPRRMKNKNKKMTSHSSPLGSPTGTPNRNSSSKHRSQESESSAMDFDDDTDSIESLVNQPQAQKQADVSWKEVPDENLFRDREDAALTQPANTSKQNVADDTDEGRGTLVTDGEGNPAHSSPEDNDAPLKVKGKILTENLQLKSTIDVLQGQVSQLQEAMLSLSDRILNRSRSDVNLDVWDEADELKLVSESQDIAGSPSQKAVDVQPNDEEDIDPEPMMSARGEVPKISLKNALTTLRSALSEDELWALCEQAGHCIKNKSVKRYLALETTYVRKDGRIEFADCKPGEVEIDEMYLAPEVLENKSETSTKSSVFSLSVVLWSAADWEMSADQAPQLSQELESLLVVMSQDDITQRAEVDDVIKICEDHHAKAGVNSLCVCSSLFAEVQDALTLSNSGKLIQKKIALDVSKEQETLTKKMFKDNVVPDINAGTWRPTLKPVSERVLSPRRAKDPTPHEKLMSSLSSTARNLKKSPRPKVFGVREMFLKNPDLVQKLNILPGQRRKNQKVMRLVMRRQSPQDPASPPVSGIPTAPRALRAGVSDNVMSNNKGLNSVILRWHPSKIFDKHGQEAGADKIIGYRIYVNGHPKGMVAGTKSRALLEGLRQSTEYRVHVRAVSALGESEHSNTVIAHITSSPMRHNCEENQGFEMEEHGTGSPKKHDNMEAPNRNTSPVAPTRKPTGSVPQAKPRLGMVFPKQVEGKIDVKKAGKKMKQDDTTDSSASSEKAESKNGDDIIDRVLRRYGIQQTAAIVPGFASGSTLSPMPSNYKPKSTSTETNRRSLQNSLLDDLTKSLETSSLSSKASTTSDSAVDNEGKSMNVSARVRSQSQDSGDATAKSLALLEQLKNDLLN